MVGSHNSTLHILGKKNIEIGKNCSVVMVCYILLKILLNCVIVNRLHVSNENKIVKRGFKKSWTGTSYWKGYISVEGLRYLDYNL
jgi:hypothetical protein